jgi:hypothetical protein
MNKRYLTIRTLKTKAKEKGSVLRQSNAFEFDRKNTAKSRFAYFTFMAAHDEFNGGCATLCLNRRP